VKFSQGAGTPGTQRDIAFLQLAVKGLKAATPHTLLAEFIFSKRNYCGKNICMITKNLNNNNNNIFLQCSLCMENWHVLASVVKRCTLTLPILLL
jgi:hypothetical protein